MTHRPWSTGPPRTGDQLSLTGTCSTCAGVLVWANGRLVCPRAPCPGHRPERANA